MIRISKSAERNQRKQKDLNVRYNETWSVSMSSVHRLRRWLMNPLGSFHLQSKRTVAFFTEPMRESMQEKGASEGGGGCLIIVANVIKKLALAPAENHKQTF